MTGSFGASGFGEAGFGEAGAGAAFASVSFAIPVSGQTNTHYIKEGAPLPSGCTGNATEPGADEGNLCVFENSEGNVSGGEAEVHLQGSPTSTIGFEAVGYTAAKGIVLIGGTWAVTAG